MFVSLVYKQYHSHAYSNYRFCSAYIVKLRNPIFITTCFILCKNGRTLSFIAAIDGFLSWIFHIFGSFPSQVHRFEYGCMWKCSCRVVCVCMRVCVCGYNIIDNFGFFPFQIYRHDRMYNNRLITLRSPDPRLFVAFLPVSVDRLQISFSWLLPVSHFSVLVVQFLWHVWNTLGMKRPMHMLISVPRRWITKKKKQLILVVMATKKRIKRCAHWFGYAPFTGYHRQTRAPRMDLDFWYCNCNYPWPQSLQTHGCRLNPVHHTKSCQWCSSISLLYWWMECLSR